MGGGEMRDGEFSGAREASPEERAFHAQQFNSPPSDGNRAEEYEPRPQGEPAREAAPVERAEPREERAEPREERPEPREERSEGTQAPLDLPPPPQSKPYVVWSSSPTSSPAEPRRDE